MKRKSNFELMRIVSMFYILIWHFLYYGYIWSGSSKSMNLFWSFIVSLVFVHVNSFIILFGYFNYDKKIQFGKIIRINNSIWFYNFLFSILFIVLFKYNFSIIEIIKFTSPISHYDYWFLSCYIILYLISPILNIFIKYIDKTKFKKTLILYFVILLFLPYITNNEFYDIKNGYSLSNFIFLYFLGAYLHKYPIQKKSYFKNYSHNYEKLLFLLLYICFSFLNFLIDNLGNTMTLTNNVILTYFGNIIITGFISYNNPILIMESIFYFTYFSVLEFQNKYINIISKYVLGIYLITENTLVRSKIYNYLGFNQSYYTIRIIPRLFITIICVFIICIIIEFLRQKIFEFIYKKNFCFNIRKKCKDYLESIGLDINW